MLTRTTPLVGCLWLIASQTAVAQVERDLSAHEHGTSALNVIVDGDAVYVEFESPWANLAGFEHVPNTPEQTEVLTQAIEQLAQAQDWFVLNSQAQCQLADATVSTGMEMEEHHDEAHGDEEGHDEHHDEHHDDDHHDDEHHDDHAAARTDEDGHADHDDEHHDDDHDSEHADTSHDEDGHGAEHDHEEHEDEHFEVSSAYTFVCDNPTQIESASIGLFDIWSGIDQLNVQIVGATGQTAVQLEPGDASINLGSVL